MKRALFPLHIALGVLLAGAVFGQGGVPDLNNAYYFTEATEPVSVFCRPDGTGDALSNARVYGGGRCDATITIVLLDGNDIPIFMYPAEDIWLETSLDGLETCPGGSIADDQTNAQGETHMAGPLHAGGASDATLDDLARVVINGDNLQQDGLQIYFNSADVNGDLSVDLGDVTVIAGDYFSGEYHYRSDFYWDGRHDVSDMPALAGSWGATCP